MTTFNFFLFFLTYGKNFSNEVKQKCYLFGCKTSTAVRHVVNRNKGVQGKETTKKDDFGL
jgi:hypothetical protein